MFHKNTTDLKLIGQEFSKNIVYLPALLWELFFGIHRPTTLSFIYTFYTNAVYVPRPETFQYSPPYLLKKHCLWLSPLCGSCGSFCGVCGAGACRWIENVLSTRQAAGIKYVYIDIYSHFRYIGKFVAHMFGGWFKGGMYCSRQVAAA